MIVLIFNKKLSEDLHQNKKYIKDFEYGFIDDLSYTSLLCGSILASPPPFSKIFYQLKN